MVFEYQTKIDLAYYILHCVGNEKWGMNMGMVSESEEEVEARVAINV